MKYLEVVDVMVGQLLRRLAEAEAQGAVRFAVCVTGDHSTPALFGDHSHEPVPLAIAHVRHVVRPGHRVQGMCFFIPVDREQCMLRSQAIRFANHP